MLKRGSPRLSSQLAKLASWLTGQAEINKHVDERQHRALSCSAEVTRESVSLFTSVCISVSQIHPQMYMHNQLCVSCLPLPPSYAPLHSAPSPALCGSCAGDGSVPMVQAGCGVPGGPHDSYWCSGVQLLSHRDPGATHMHTWLQINIEAGCARMYTLCGCSHA